MRIRMGIGNFLLKTNKRNSRSREREKEIKMRYRLKREVKHRSRRDAMALIYAKAIPIANGYRPRLRSGSPFTFFHSISLRPFALSRRPLHIYRLAPLGIV